MTTMDELVDQAQNATLKAEDKKEGLEFDDGLFNRWTKYGKDRLYINNGNGFVDIKNKKVEGLRHNRYKVTVEKEDEVLKVFINAIGTQKTKVVEVR